MSDPSTTQHSVPASIESILFKVNTGNRDLLAAGLGVLAKYYAMYLQTNPRSDADTFERIFRDFEQEEIASHGGSEYYLPAAQTGILSLAKIPTSSLQMFLWREDHANEACWDTPLTSRLDYVTPGIEVTE